MDGKRKAGGRAVKPRALDVGAAGSALHLLRRLLA
jgi:hypothetical protein